MDIIVHQVHSGPYEDEFGSPYLVVKAQDGEGLYDLEIFFDSFDDAYRFNNHFLTKIEPLTLHIEDGDTYV